MISLLFPIVVRLSFVVDVNQIIWSSNDCWILLTLYCILTKHIFLIIVLVNDILRLLWFTCIVGICWMQLKSQINRNIPMITCIPLIIFFFYWFYERKREEEREGEKCGCKRETLISCLLHTPLTGNQTCNPGMCREWETKPATLWSVGWCPTDWAVPARAMRIPWLVRGKYSNCNTTLGW